MKLSRTLAAAAAFCLVSVLPAQIQTFGGKSERVSAALFFYSGTDQSDFKVHGAINISYCTGTWKDNYDGMIADFKGTMQRIGGNWGMVLETTVAITFGTTAVQPGVYYVGAKISDAGAISLVLMDSAEAIKNNWTPFMGNTWKPKYEVALTQTKADAKTEKLDVDISLEKGKTDQGTLTLKWGPHVFTAAAKFGVSAGAPADAGAKKDAGADAKKK